MTSSSAGDLVISRTSLRKATRAAAAIVLLILIVIATATITRHLDGSSSNLPAAINRSDFQSVLLTNGQLYFGRLSAAGAEAYVLRHVYYLASQSSSAGQPAQRTLVPLVKDVQGPEDLMVIPRNEVVYIENLRPSGAAATLLTKSEP